MAEKLVPTLEGRLREPRGKQAVKHLRLEGRVPAVLYHSNPDKTVTSLALDFAEQDIRNLVAHRPTLIQVNWGRGEHEQQECVLREVQRHPVTQVPIHLDLLGVQQGVKMEATVPLHLKGTPVGVKDQGGVLQQSLYEIDIRCLPKDLPTEIVVDVSGLEIGHSLHIRDIQVTNVEVFEEGSRTIASVIVPRAAVEEAAEAAAEGEAAGEGEAEAGEGESEDKE